MDEASFSRGGVLEHRGFVSCGDLLRQLLRGCYPRLLAPDLLSQEDVEAFLRGDARGDDARPNVDEKKRDETARSGFSGFAALAADAEREFQSAWRAFARVGDDGDVCFAGFDDTTMLDFVSRGLDCRKLEEKRRGDFEPGHRVAVFAEQPTEQRRRAARSSPTETNGSRRLTRFAVRSIRRRSPSHPPR